MARRVAAILAVWILTGVLALPAAAAQTGTVRVKLDGVGPEDRASVMLVQVAEKVEGGYRLREGFGGGLIRQEEACSVELARWLADRSGSAGTVRETDESGVADFPELEQGLYLVIQTKAAEGWNCVAPFLVPIPLDGEWTVMACPKQSVLLTQSPKTGQHPEPVFAAMGLVMSGMGLYLCVEKLRKK